MGKTNAKLAVVDAASLTEIAVIRRPNTVLEGPPWPHADLEGHWAFFLENLAQFHQSHGIDAISVTTHGAAAVLLDAGGHLVLPMLDYEHRGPDRDATAYDALRPDFAETGSARLPHGLNLGAQLHWIAAERPADWARVAHVVTYPQYWGYRLTGAFGTDVTSLGCHTDLWNPREGRFSTLVERLGLTGKLAEPRRPAETLGRITAEVAERTGLDPATPVAVGIHDSNASLLPHLRRGDPTFAVVSTGTWVVAMAVGGRADALDPARDTLVNVNALGDPVPSARFMGGREYELIRQGGTARPTTEDRARMRRAPTYLLPSIEPGSGPFPGLAGGWTRAPETEGLKMLGLGWYLALMTDTCLDLVGARGPVVVEGPFAGNEDYLAMLAALRPDVEIAASATGTSIGAAMLMLPDAPPPATTRVPQPADVAELCRYARDWQALITPERARAV